MRSSRNYWRSAKEKAANGTPEEFEVVLGLCLADLAAGRATLEDCLKRYPVHADQLAELLPLAEQEQAIPPPDRGPSAFLSAEQSSAPVLPADQGPTVVLPPDQGPTATLSDSPPDALVGSPAEL